MRAHISILLGLLSAIPGHPSRAGSLAGAASAQGDTPCAPSHESLPRRVPHVRRQQMKKLPLISL